jgi:hypothetical protein
MLEKLAQLPDWWIGAKDRLAHAFFLSKDAMHIHIALVIMVVTALVLRKRFDSIWGWLAVLLAELFNEYCDLSRMQPGDIGLDASIHDIYNTMFWPTMFLVFGRFLFPRRTKLKMVEAGAVSDTGSGNLADQTFEKPPSV